MFFYRKLSMRQKPKTFEIRDHLIKKIDFFPQTLSHIPRWVRLEQKNASEKFSRLGTFKEMSYLYFPFYGVLGFNGETTVVCSDSLIHCLYITSYILKFEEQIRHKVYFSSMPFVWGLLGFRTSLSVNLISMHCPPVPLANFHRS